MKKRRPKRTPEERARSARIQRELLEAIRRHDQRFENARAAREGRPPAIVPLRVPDSEEVRRELASWIERYARRARDSA